MQSKVWFVLCLLSWGAMLALGGFEVWQRQEFQQKLLALEASNLSQKQAVVQKLKEVVDTRTEDFVKFEALQTSLRETVELFGKAESRAAQVEEEAQEKIEFYQKKLKKTTEAYNAMKADVETWLATQNTK